MEKVKLEAKDRPEPRYYSSCINSAWAKLNKYYTKLDETPVYYASTVLHPGIQWTFLTKAYGGREDWVDKARQLIQTLWEEEYHDLPIQWQLADSILPVAVRARESNPFDSFQDELMSYSTSEKEPIADEFERWLSTKQDIYTKHDSPLRYWSAKRFEYPRVARVAIDVLSIPPMAAENVIDAVFDITDGSLSQYQASEKYGVAQPVLSKRLLGQKSRKESTHTHQHLSPSQEDRFVRWILRQVPLGYALSHSQLRSCVEALLRQQGDNKPLGKNWTSRFIKHHSKLSTKLGKRQESARFDGFTPRSANWYLNIREDEYGWIKPENTVNVDERGIMASFARTEWMATCFLNNVYCCYLPALCSHGLQPFDNGDFNVVKGACRKELQKLASLTDSAPVDRVNFIRAYAKAREAGMRKEIVLPGWRLTGNWPINRHRALSQPEIQPDREKLLEQFKTRSPYQLHSDDTPKTSRQVRDLAKHRSRPTRRTYSKISKGLEALEMKVAVQNGRITGLEE
ncbi:hypothetical protein H9L39_19226 [Fusarium oxysporum f. sp. albedinis]|nr:hypothetical protein H9L39_19226 [Fusarium oxysporum f. sp. albedinis]